MHEQTVGAIFKFHLNPLCPDIELKKKFPQCMHDQRCADGTQPEFVVFMLFLLAILFREFLQSIHVQCQAIYPKMTENSLKKNPSF